MPPLLDPETIAALDALADADEPDVVVELFQLFLTDTPRRLEAIRAAADAANTPALRFAAHALKGSAGNVGAMQLRIVCLELERRAVAGEIARELVGSLERLAKATEIAIRTEMAGRAA